LGPIPVSGVSELVLEVADTATAEDFYSGLLGFPVVERWKERDAVWVMAGDRTRIGLWSPQVGIAGGRGGRHVHFAMKIDEADWQAVAQRLEIAGKEVHVEDFGERGHGVYVTDPDGNVVEFWSWDVAGHLRPG